MSIEIKTVSIVDVGVIVAGYWYGPIESTFRPRQRVAVGLSLRLPGRVGNRGWMLWDGNVRRDNVVARLTSADVSTLAQAALDALAPDAFHGAYATASGQSAESVLSNDVHGRVAVVVHAREHDGLSQLAQSLGETIH